METRYQLRVMQLISKRWLVGLLCIIGSVAQASALPTFDAEYTAFRYGKKLGYALLSVENVDDETYRMEYHSKVSLFFLSDKRTEISDFAFIDDKIVQGQKEFSYQVINYRGQERDYHLKVMGTEQLTLPYGMLEGIKVEIVRHNSTRETFAWFSPQLNYQLVRLQQFKDDKEQGDIQLKTFTATQ